MKPAVKPTSESLANQNAADLDAIYAKIARRIIPFMVLLFITKGSALEIPASSRT